MRYFTPSTVAFVLLAVSLQGYSSPAPRRALSLASRSLDPSQPHTGVPAAAPILPVDQSQSGELQRRGKKGRGRGRGNNGRGRGNNGRGRGRKPHPQTGVKGKQKAHHEVNPQVHPPVDVQKESTTLRQPELPDKPATGQAELADKATSGQAVLPGQQVSQEVPQRKPGATREHAKNALYHAVKGASQIAQQIDKFTTPPAPLEDGASQFSDEPLERRDMHALKAKGQEWWDGIQGKKHEPGNGRVFISSSANPVPANAAPADPSGPGIRVIPVSRRGVNRPHHEGPSDPGSELSGRDSDALEARGFVDDAMNA